MPKFSIGVHGSGHGADAESLKYDIARKIGDNWVNTVISTGFSLNTLTTVAGSAITQTGYYRISFKGNDIYGHAYSTYTSYFYYDCTAPAHNFTLFDGLTYGIRAPDQTLRAPVLHVQVDSVSTSPNLADDLNLIRLSSDQPLWGAEWTRQGGGSGITREGDDLFSIDLAAMWSQVSDFADFQYYLEDIYGIFARDTFRLYKDTSPIEVDTISNPSPGTAYFYNGNLVYDAQGMGFSINTILNLGHPTIGQSDLMAIEFTYNGGSAWTSVPITGSVTTNPPYKLTVPITFSLPASDGVYSLGVRTTDLRYNQETRFSGYNIIVDTASPIVEILNAPAMVSGDFEAQFYITESTLMSAAYEISSGGIIHKAWTAWANIAANTPQTRMITWPTGIADGTYNVKIRATDVFGREHEAAFEVDLATSGPVLESCTVNGLESPLLASPAIVGPMLAIAWSTAAGAMNGVFTANYYMQRLGVPASFEQIGGATYGGATYADTLSYSLAAYAEGTYILVLTLTNSIDAISAYTYYFTIDKTAPVVACENQFVRANTLIPATITETHPAQLQYTFQGKDYFIDLAPHSPATSPFTVNLEIPNADFDALTEGVYGLTVVVTDQAGNFGSILRQITVDRTAPVVSLFIDADRSVLLTNNSYWNAPPTFYAVIAEPLAYSITVQAMSITQNLGQTTTIAIPSSLFDIFDDLSTIMYQIAITDLAGNAKHYLVLVRKDMVLPQIAIQSPAANQLLGVNSPTIMFTATDTALSHGALTIRIQATSEIAYTMALTADHLIGGSVALTPDVWSAIESGSFILEIEVWDQASNYKMATKAFSVDKIAPLLTVKAPTLYAAVSAAAPVYIIECTDDHLQSVIYYIEGQETRFTINSNDYTGVINQEAWDLIKTKTVKIHFVATDKVGNTAEVVVIVYRDDIASDGWNREPTIDWENLTYNMGPKMMMLLGAVALGTVLVMTLPDAIKKRMQKLGAKAKDVAAKAAKINSQASQFMTNADHMRSKWRGS